MLEFSETQNIFFELDTSPIDVVKVSYAYQCSMRVFNTDTQFKKHV